MRHIKEATESSNRLRDDLMANLNNRQEQMKDGGREEINIYRKKKIVRGGDNIEIIEEIED